MIDAIAEIGDELHLLAGLSNKMRVDAVCDRRHEHVRRAHGLDKLVMRRGLVAYIEARVEQFAHARFDRLGEPARDHYERLFLPHLTLRPLASVDCRSRPKNRPNPPPLSVARAHHVRNGRLRPKAAPNIGHKREISRDSAENFIFQLRLNDDL